MSVPSPVAAPAELGAGSPMTPAAFAEAQALLLTLASLAVDLEADAMLATLERTRFHAPLVLEDRAWSGWLASGEQQLAACERLIRSLQPFREEIARQCAAASTHAQSEEK